MTYRGFRNALIVCGFIAVIIAVVCGFQAKQYYEYSQKKNLVEIVGTVVSYQEETDMEEPEIVLEEYNSVFYFDTNIKNLVKEDILEEIKKSKQCILQIFSEDVELLNVDSYIKIQQMTIDGKECLKWTDVKNRYQMVGIFFTFFMILALGAMAYFIYCVTGKRYYVVTE